MILYYKKNSVVLFMLTCLCMQSKIKLNYMIKVEIKFILINNLDKINQDSMNIGL